MQPKNGYLLSILTLIVLTIFPPEGEKELGSWRWQNPQPQGNPIYAMAFSQDGAQESRGIAVGRDGTILCTEENGQRWRSIRSPINIPLYGVTLRNRRAWAVGARGTILTSGDSG